VYVLADGRAPPITAISSHGEITTVYNLSIEHIHTFYVGQNSVLVHNCDPALLTEGTGQSVVRPVARWGAGWYKDGGFQTSIEHINYRHAFESGFSDVSKFAKEASVRDIKDYVEEAVNYGKLKYHPLSRFITGIAVRIGFVGTD
jgi:hypothetical protein